MKVLLAAFLCLLAGGAVFGQAPDEGIGEAPRVAKFTLAKKEKNGTITEDPERFRTTDVPIICYVDLTTDKPTEVKLTIVAVKAVGLRPESKLLTVNYKTEDGENGATFTVRPEGKWAPGLYRAEVYLNGRQSDSVTYTVSDSTP
jgi:hypothetical protein